MTQMLERVARGNAPGEGLLRCEHFQVAYVTNDIDQAIDLLSRRLGVGTFAALGGPMPEGGTMDARFAWVGTVMYEVIHASGPGAAVFTDRLAGASGFVLRHHHLGYLVHSPAEYAAVLVEAERHDFAVPWTTSNPLVDACMIAIPGFEHLHEYLLPTAAGLQFFHSVPRH